MVKLEQLQPRLVVRSSYTVTFLHIHEAMWFYNGNNTQLTCVTYLR